MNSCSDCNEKVNSGWNLKENKLGGTRKNRTEDIQQLDGELT